MHGTREVVKALRDSNPDANVTEERVRYAIRRGDVARPALVCGRFIWSRADIAALAAAFGLTTGVSDDVVEMGGAA